jgi:Aspartyl protease
MKKHFYFLYTLVLLLFPGSVLNAQNAHKPAGPGMHGQDVPAGVTLSGSRVEVPLQIVNKKIVLEARINGKGPFKFFLDTGAGATVLDQSLATELSLPVKGVTHIGDPKDPQGILGNRNDIETLDLGGASFKNFIAISWDRSGLYKPDGPRGVLGMPLFKNLLLTIDYPQNKVLVTRGDLAAGAAGVFTYEPADGGIFALPVKIAGADQLATLDTGSPGGISFPGSFMEKLPLDGKPVEIGRGRTVGGEAVIYGAKLNGKVIIAGHEFESPRVTFFDRLQRVNLGYDLLNPFAITIDQKNRRMKFEKTAPAATAATAKPAVSNEYDGLYGERRIAVENGSLFLQRISGPQGEGPKLKLAEIAKDEYALPDTKTVRIKFVRDQAGKVIEVMVLNRQGEWERVKKG